ncbi:SRPBCC family protein [uncultured Flavobacterium sp.]|uniref:SRPBCC family protein n=1 Tax=uncultured Flavobacterium sp. TaxID=165435 RepID=UPI0025DE2228|nr:SRPBCC family protein [uncultured Flavobacterium sp.]
MTKIILQTKIKAPIETVFNLSRNIDIHQESASSSKEKVIAGKTSGLIELNETVTWKGKHFGIYLKHSSKITEMEFPNYFVDIMEKGHFKSFRHEHYFEEKNGFTTMKDLLTYETPFGIFGRIFDYILLKNHMKNFLLERNTILKNIAENQTK